MFPGHLIELKIARVSFCRMPGLPIAVITFGACSPRYWLNAFG